MSRAQPTTDFVRGSISGLIAAVVAIAIVLVFTYGVGIDSDDTRRVSVLAYVIAWPVYAATYIVWSYAALSRLSRESLEQAGAADSRTEKSLVPRLLGVTGAANTTISAAIVAVIVTIAIAQQPEFRGEAIYIVLALITVASSWALMVFTFAQGYLRLGAAPGPRPHLTFHFPEPPKFSDYLTLALLVSTMAATVSTEISSRAAWRVVRTNVIIAFVFNSVIIAMMVSLLFGGLIS